MSGFLKIIGQIATGGKEKECQNASQYDIAMGPLCVRRKCEVAAHGHQLSF